MRKRGTHCIAPKLRRVHFEGSITLRGALQRLQNSAGQILTANLPRKVFEPAKCAPRNYGAFQVRPAELWSLQSAPRRIMEPLKCASRSFEAMQRVPRFLMET